MEPTTKQTETFLAHRAKEPTTWAGIVQLGLSAWAAFQIGNVEGAVMAGILAVTGAISIFRKERKK